MTIFFILITIVVSVLAFRSPSLSRKLTFNPYAVHYQKQGFRFLSSGFVHADFIHLFVNMFVLYSFGSIVEYNYSEAFGERGSFYFILLYLSSIPIALLPDYNKHKENPMYNSLGASGAVSAVVFSYILFDPLNKLCLYGIICLPGIIFGLIYIGYCIYMAKRGDEHINHGAHLWGALYGFTFTVLLRPSLLTGFFDKLIYFRNVI